jgi:MFS-type transporter involved in bile tolerance (Atg22 family)
MIAHELASDVDEKPSPTERRNSRRYTVELFAAMAAYIVLLLASARIINRVPPGAEKYAIALLPMGGIVAAAIAIVRFVRRTDEFQRHTLLTCGAIAGLVTAVVTMALGFLENAGMSRIGMTAVWPMTAIVFAICLPFVRRRYR